MKGLPSWKRAPGAMWKVQRRPPSATSQAALNDVISAGHNDSLVYTARVRLARVLVQAGDTDGALNQLDGKFPEAWVGQAAEVRDLPRVRLGAPAEAAVPHRRRIT